MLIDNVSLSRPPFGDGFRSFLSYVSASSCLSSSSLRVVAAFVVAFVQSSDSKFVNDVFAVTETPDAALETGKALPRN